MDVFPAFYPLAGRRIGLAGEGEGLEARRRLLIQSPAELVMLPPESVMTASGWSGLTLGFIASSDADFAARAAASARQAGVPVNVMDRPALCDFTVPALIDRGALVAAFGTGGVSPLIAARLRAELEPRVPEGLGRLARFLEDNRDDLRRRWPDTGERRVFLSSLLEGPVAAAVLEGRPEADARDLLRQAIDGALRPVGRIFALHPATPADLLSLRALRVLSTADILVAGPDEGRHLAGFARREARWLTPDSVSPQDVADLQADGRIIILLTAPEPWWDAGVEPETLPVAGLA